MKITKEGALNLFKDRKRVVPAEAGSTGSCIGIRSGFQSLSTGPILLDRLVANISPIFQKGDRSTPRNYRPVSLTSICCKVLDHIVHRNNVQHIDHDNFGLHQS